MAFFNLFGGKNKPNKIIGLSLGEDRTATKKAPESTGIFLADTKNLLAYGSFPDAIGMAVLVTPKGRKLLGQVAIFYEPMSRPFSFIKLDWVEAERLNDETVILRCARSEAKAKAVQQMELEDRFDRMFTILLLLCGIFGALALMYAIQSGTLSRLFGG